MKTVREELEHLCWLVADMPGVVVSVANQNGLPWIQDIRDRARRILARKDEEEQPPIIWEDKMEPVRYKGYTIEVKHYPAFTHSRREYPEVFDYVTTVRGWALYKGYSFNSAEEAITEAKRFIDKAGSPPVSP